jgi:hypothetical protein
MYDTEKEDSDAAFLTLDFPVKPPWHQEIVFQCESWLRLGQRVHHQQIWQSLLEQLHLALGAIAAGVNLTGRGGLMGWIGTNSMHMWGRSAVGA